MFIAVTILFMPKALFGGGLFAPLDLLHLASPWRDATPTAGNVQELVQNDFVQSIPVIEAMVHALRGGHWLMWSPYIAGGEPVGALVTSGFQDPFNILLVILPAVSGLAIVTALRLLFCQTFFYLFLRRLGVSSPIATFGAVAFTFCGTQIALLGRINAYLILPMMLWATLRILQRRRAIDVALLGIASALSWLAGFPSGFANTVAIDVLFAIFVAAAPAVRSAGIREWLRSAAGGLALVACGLALSAGLVAVSLLPNERILERSGLVQQRLYTSADHEAAADLMGSFSVDALGSLHDVTVLNDSQPGQPTNGGVSVEIESGSGLIVTVAALVGALLAIAGRIRLTRPQRAAYLYSLVVLVVCLILVYFKTPLLGLFYDLPLIGSNPVNRLRIVVDVCFAILACLGIEGFRADRAARVALGSADATAAGSAPPRTPVRSLKRSDWTDPGPPGSEPARSTMTLQVTCVLALGALAYLISRAWNPYSVWLRQGVQSHSRHELEIELVAGIIATALMLGALWWAATRPRWRGWVLSLTGLVLALATFATTGRPIRYFTPTVSSHWLLPRTAGHAELAKLTGRRYRILGSGLGTFYSDTSIYYRYLDLRGLSITSPAFRLLVSSAIPNAYALDHFKVIYTPPSDPIDFRSPVLDDLGVRYFIGGTDEIPFATDRAAPAATGTRVVSARHPLHATITADRNLTGFYVPVQLASATTCEGSRIRVAVATPAGRTLSAALRPGTDVPVTAAVPAVFTYPVAALSGQHRVRVTISLVAARAPCRISVGTRHGQPDLSQLVHRAGQLPIVSNDEGVFYKRAHAHPIVWTTGDWQPAATSAQALALATLPSRTPRSPVPVAGAGPPSHATGGSVQHVGYVSDGVDVRTRTTGSELVATGFAGDSSDWTVTVDGHRSKLASVDGGLLGTVVPAGTHTARFRYTPPDFTEGAVISIVSLIILIGLIVADRRDVPPPWRWRRLSAVRGR